VIRFLGAGDCIPTAFGADVSVVINILRAGTHLEAQTMWHYSKY